jgi:para-nitrobenzyl esterase
MVFGQSGGGAKIATLMGMPAAAGLFHSAATMSGQQVTASGPMHATERARAYLARLKVTPADLLSMRAERLTDALDTTDPIMGGGVYFGPVLDMKWLTRHPFWPDANPQSNSIPMVLGNTHDETRAFIGRERLKGLSWDDLADRMAPELRVDIKPEWVVSEYRRLFPVYTPEQVFYAATTAGRSWRGQVEEAEARAKANAPTWVYQVDFASPVEPWRGAPHTMDIPLVFGTLDVPGSFTGTGPDARAVSDAMMRAFIALAAKGNPGWVQYRPPERATMIFDAPPHLENDPRREQRELFARVPYIQPGT